MGASWSRPVAVSRAGSLTTSKPLIETIAWAHEHTAIANLLQWKDKPVALSIVQARFVGLAHFSVGYVLTYGPFVISSTIAIG